MQKKKNKQKQLILFEINKINQYMPKLDVKHLSFEMSFGIKFIHNKYISDKFITYFKKYVCNINKTAD